MATNGSAGAATEGRTQAAGTLRALALANIRFWPTVAPAVQEELRSWRPPAEAIPDAALRRLALDKLAGERFNAEVAATLATLAPRARRRQVVRAIVALELLFDYLDGRTEMSCPDPLGTSERLFEPFIDAVTPPGGERRQRAAPEQAPADWGYLAALSARARRATFALPGAAQLAAVARASARRCAQAQTRLHAAPQLGGEQLQRWADEHAVGSGLQWREYAAGCASSVLAMHALIAIAADSAAGEQDGRRTDAAYLAIGAVITILDSVVDRAQDGARGHPGFIRLYEPGELPARMRALTREALRRTQETPHGDHHAMTLAGVVAYYASHPGAREHDAREVLTVVRRELSPTIRPALAVMRCWRAAKSARAGVEAVTGTACDGQATRAPRRRG